MTTQQTGAKGDGPYVTPLVHQLAAQHGVDLRALNGSGVGGRIRKQDVLDAIPADRRPTPPPPAPRAVLAVNPAARGKQVQRKSVWNTSVTVSVNPWGTNPLVDDARQATPDTYRAAASEAPAPTLFASGDLPIFIASGADPRLLMNLPWQVRHPAANAEGAKLTGLLELYGAEDGETLAEMDYSSHTENQAYRYRVSNWLSGAGIDPSKRASPDATKSVYSSIYGAEEAHHAKLRAAAEDDRQARAKFDAEQAARVKARQAR